MRWNSRRTSLVAIVILSLFFLMGKMLWPNYCTPTTDKEQMELSVLLRTLGDNILHIQQDFDGLSQEYYFLDNHLKMVNDILKTINHEGIDKLREPSTGQVSKPKKQEICPEMFAGQDLAYGAPYYRLGFARVKCDDFVPIDKLVTLLMLVPNDYGKPAMSYIEMMTRISNEYPEVKVVLVTEKELPKATMERISALKIKFENQLIQGIKGRMWARLVDQVETPYVLIAPYLTHFDDDIDLYRLLRVLSYRDDVAVAGGSYRNLTGHWDLGCRQTSFDYWTLKYTAGYYRSFNECVVCDYLPGPFTAKTEWLKMLKFDTSLSEGIFHDLFWRFKNQGLRTHGNLAVVCADVMFNIDHPKIEDEAFVTFAGKHDIKKMVAGDGTVRWYGCRQGLSYTVKTVCVWPAGVGVPPCDLWNLGEVVKFVMEACKKGEMLCEYAAGDIVGAVRFGSPRMWGKNAEIYFHTKNFTAFDKLRRDFERVGFTFKSDKTGLGSFTISTKHWDVMMFGRGSLDPSSMLIRNQLPTRVLVRGTWVRVPRNPGLFARGHFLAGYFSKQNLLGGSETQNERGSYDMEETPMKCPNPRHSACLDRYPAGSNIPFLNHLP